MLFPGRVYNSFVQTLATSYVPRHAGIVELVSWLSNEH